jgi:surface antigen
LEDAKQKPTYDVDDYISVFNRPAYDRLVQEQAALADSQKQLDELLQTRQDTVEDLEALKNRLVSFDKNVNLETVPRVQALESQLAALDTEIANVQHDIGDLKANIADLNHRLTLVKPGAGADLNLIITMETSQTSEWIKQNTQDCVNYIVNRMPIPGGMPADAHLWDEMAQKFPQYGITSGNVPLVGSVIVMETPHSYASDLYGHLMYVESIDGADVWVTDNLHAEPVKLSDLTAELSGDNLKYLYFPWHTKV